MILRLVTLVLVALLVKGCNCSCGGIFQQTHGILRSPVSGTKIGQITRCDYVLLVPSKQRIKVVFVDLVLKTTCCSCKHDYIELRDGKDANSTLIGRYCAQNIPKKVYSTQNELWIRFQTDFRTSSENRFKLKFDTTCGRHFDSLAGSFSSKGLTYKPNTECIYTISVPRGRIKVSFDVFDLEGSSSVCEFDFIEVKEIKNVELSSDVLASRRRRFCGKNKPPTIYSTIGSFLWFRFKTDSNRQNSGFTANFRTVSVGEGSCDTKFASEKGFIYSKNYPFTYPKNTECTWEIEVDSSKRVHLIFDTFNFSRKVQGCNYGYVNVYDDIQLKSPIGQFCGPDIPRDIVSRSSKLTLKSVSSDIPNTGWFSIRYRSSDEGPCGSKKFACVSHQCIEADQQCDGNKDCADGSDEQKCPPMEEKLSWYSYWPVTVVIVMLFMGIWLWRTWRKFITPRSNVEVSYYCASPCHHHDNGHVTEVMEPPSYNEAILSPVSGIPPPSYEEAISSQPTQYTITHDVDREDQSETGNTNSAETRTVCANLNTTPRSTAEDQRPSSETSVNSLGQPYTSHRLQDRISEV